jgi:hypothetical protein
VAVPVRVRVCNVEGVCVPVHFQFEMVGDAVCIHTDDVNEVVAAIHAADDDLQAQDDEDAE